MHITWTPNSLKASSLEVFADSCCLSPAALSWMRRRPSRRSVSGWRWGDRSPCPGTSEFRRGSSEGQISIRIYIQLLIHVKRSVFCVRRSVWKDLWPWSDLTWVHVFTVLSAESVLISQPSRPGTRVLGPVMVFPLVLNTLVSTPLPGNMTYTHISIFMQHTTNHTGKYKCTPKCWDTSLCIKKESTTAQVLL